MAPLMAQLVAQLPQLGPAGRQQAGTVSYASDRVLRARAGGALGSASVPADDLVSLVRTQPLCNDASLAAA